MLTYKTEDFYSLFRNVDYAVDAEKKLYQDLKLLNGNENDK